MERFEAGLYRPVLYTLLVIVVVTFVLNPIGLPMKIGERPKAFLSTLDDIPDGSVIWYGIDTGAGGLPELRAAMVAIAKYCFERDIGILFSSFGYQGPLIYDILLEDVPIPEGKEYGVDYAFLGYIAGGETAHASVTKDIRSLLSVDNFGNPLDSLEIMEDVNSAEDLSFVLCFTSAQDTVNAYIRQWVTPYNTKFGLVVLSAMGPPTEPYYPKQVNALLSSAKQGAEFELLIGKPGYGVASMDAQSAVHVMLLCFIAAGNAYTMISKRNGGGR
jgi:hypothetical protein